MCATQNTPASASVVAGPTNATRLAERAVQVRAGFGRAAPEDERDAAHREVEPSRHDGVCRFVRQDAREEEHGREDREQDRLDPSRTPRLSVK